jgi:dipeptidase E
VGYLSTGREVFNVYSTQAAGDYKQMKIVAIGGGEIGRPGTKIETQSIDEEVVRLTGKAHPKLLFIPTASGDSEGYLKVVQDYYGKKLGCEVEVLYLIRDKPTQREIQERVKGADIVYVGGGNTLRMLRWWRKYGLDEILKEALERGTVLSGISAGAICWFKYGNSDSIKFSDARNPLIKIRGLDFLPIMACPHYDYEKERRPSLQRMIQENGGVSIALDNCAALEVIDNRYRILTSTKGARAYLVYKSEGKVIEEPLPVDHQFRPLEELTRKMKKTFSIENKG